MSKDYLIPWAENLKQENRIYIDKNGKEIAFYTKFHDYFKNITIFIEKINKNKLKININLKKIFQVIIDTEAEDNNYFNIINSFSLGIFYIGNGEFGNAVKKVYIIDKEKDKYIIEVFENLYNYLNHVYIELENIKRKIILKRHKINMGILFFLKEFILDYFEIFIKSYILKIINLNNLGDKNKFKYLSITIKESLPYNSNFQYMFNEIDIGIYNKCNKNLESSKESNEALVVHITENSNKIAYSFYIQNKKDLNKLDYFINDVLLDKENLEINIKSAIEYIFVLRNVFKEKILKLLVPNKAKLSYEERKNIISETFKFFFLSKDSENLTIFI